MATHSLEASAMVFAISLLIGGVAIYLGAKVAFKSRNFSHAVVTALLGAIAWTLVDLAFGRIGIGGLLASVAGLLIWVWVVRWRYDVGWIRGSFLGFAAWIAALVVIGVLSILGVGGLEAYGIPGT